MSNPKSTISLSIYNNQVSQLEIYHLLVGYWHVIDHNLCYKQWESPQMPVGRYCNGLHIFGQSICGHRSYLALPVARASPSFYGDQANAKQCSLSPVITMRNYRHIDCNIEPNNHVISISILQRYNVTESRPTWKNNLSFLFMLTSIE